MSEPMSQTEREAVIVSCVLLAFLLVFGLWVGNALRTARCERDAARAGYQMGSMGVLSSDCLGSNDGVTWVLVDR